MRYNDRRKTDSPVIGEVWFAKDIPFDDGINRKGRPVIVLGIDGEYVSCYRCTSKNAPYRNRYPIVDLDSSGLDVDTYVDLERSSVPNSKLVCRLGRLSKSDCEHLHIKRFG